MFRHKKLNPQGWTSVQLLGVSSELTAEGVETLHQRDLLVGYGCHYGQGWLYGKAMSLADVCRLPEVLEPNERATSEPSS
jgi:EAL domain-containing protein (putative c-di-GMP-specific phosphodiesterase class I)